MSKALSRAEWSDGETVLHVHSAQSGLEYELKSSYKADVDKRNPPSITYSPEALRALIQRTRTAVADDPFVDGDFTPLVNWLEENGKGVIAQVEDDGVRKEFRMKWNEDNDSPYLKAQRWKNGSNLRDSPTLGSGEFKQIFGQIAVL